MNNAFYELLSIAEINKHVLRKINLRCLCTHSKYHMWNKVLYEKNKQEVHTYN